MVSGIETGLIPQHPTPDGPFSSPHAKLTSCELSLQWWGGEFRETQVDMEASTSTDELGCDKGLHHSTQIFGCSLLNPDEVTENRITAFLFPSPPVAIQAA